MILVEDEARSETLMSAFSGHGLSVSHTAPAPGVGNALKSKNPACFVINLATPAGWAALRELRAGEKTAMVPLVAYALPAGGAMGFWFGPVDFAVLPVAGRIHSILKKMVPKVRRILGVGADLDVMGGVRNELNAVASA